MPPESPKWCTIKHNIPLPPPPTHTHMNKVPFHPPLPTGIFQNKPPEVAGKGHVSLN